MHTSPIFRSLAEIFRIPLPSQVPINAISSRLTNAAAPKPSFQHIAPFSSTAPMAKKNTQKKGDKRISTHPPSPYALYPSILNPLHPSLTPASPNTALIRYHLQHPLTPRPLRLSRLRSLRHWTIHRAYLLHRRQLLTSQERELERQYNSMRDACEELRTGCGDGGRLFRVAMSKKGVWAGVPVEYARCQTEGPGREGWDFG
ncbi:MAG: hypothetical protein M1830_001483, partial [Pleopsidium flavum]